MKNGAVSSGPADAGVGSVTHSAVSVAKMTEQAFHLIFHVTGFDAAHNFFVRVGRNAIRVANHFQFHVRLVHAKFRDHGMEEDVIHCDGMVMRL